MGPLKATWTLGILVSLSFLISLVFGGYIPPGPKYNCPPRTHIWPCTCHSPSDDGISLDCYDVSLAVLSSALAYPVSVGMPIQSLNITELRSQRLFGPIFQATNTTKLLISGNDLETILSDAFLPLRNSLKELEILSTSLSEFPYSAVSELDSLESLWIRGHYITNISSPIKGLPSLKNIQIAAGNVSVISKETFSQIGGKLARLDLHDNSLNGVPKDAFSSLKNLEFLDIAKNQWQKLEPGDFFHLSKLTWLNASHNEIPDFKRGAFARNAFLRVLNLSFNKIPKIDAAAFRGMRLLVRLYLGDNQIKEIGRGAFGSLLRIKTIDLARNQLSIADFQMFQKLPFCEEILLQENNITTIKAGAFTELTQFLLNISHNALATIEKGAFTTCVNMTVLDMSHNKLKNFTKGAFDEYSYPDEWRLDYNELKLTQDVPIKFMAQMRILNISHNSLVEVGRHTFPKLYELHTVDLSFNNISKIHGAVFTVLGGLRILDMRSNSLKELTGSSLGTIPTLLELRLDFNKLKTVSAAAFNKLVSLRTLSLSYNNLTKVPQISGSLNEIFLSHNDISSLSRAWPEMNALQRLDLSFNKLGAARVAGPPISQEGPPPEEIEGEERTKPPVSPGPGSFSNLAPLSFLNISHNGIKAVPKEALADLQTCQTIDLSGNEITELERGAFGRLPIVFNLHLANNRISSIASRAFDGLIQMLKLDLSGNLLGSGGPSSLPADAFQGLVALRTLNLSHNKIQRTENGSHSFFQDNLSLRTLDLSYNEISALRKFSLPQAEWTHYQLQHLNLSHNSLSAVTGELLRGTRTLLTLNLASNRIAEVKPFILKNLPLLKKLDLSHNSLGSLETKMLGPPPEIKELDLSHNMIRRFPLDILSLLPGNFSLLNLEGNRLREFYPEFGTLIEKNGTRILISGNGVLCSCSFIPLKRYFEMERSHLSNRSTEFFQDFQKLKCKEENGEELLIHSVEESSLACDYSDDPLGPRLDIPPKKDLEIREVKEDFKVPHSPRADVRWRVTSKKDVSGFLILTGNHEDGIQKAEMVGYSARRFGIPLTKTLTKVCIIPFFSTEGVASGGESLVGRGWDVVKEKMGDCHALNPLPQAYNIKDPSSSSTRRTPLPLGGPYLLFTLSISMIILHF